MALETSVLRSGNVRARSEAQFNSFGGVDFLAGVDRSRIFELGHCLAENQDFPRASAVSRGGGLAENLDFVTSPPRLAVEACPKIWIFSTFLVALPGLRGPLGPPGPLRRLWRLHPSDLLRCRRRSQRIGR